MDHFNFPGQVDIQWRKNLKPPFAHPQIDLDFSKKKVNKFNKFKKFNEEVNSKMKKIKTCYFSTFQNIILSVLNKSARIKNKTCHYNHNNFMSKSPSKAIRSKSNLNKIKISRIVRNRETFALIFKENRKTIFQEFNPCVPNALFL